MCRQCCITYAIFWAYWAAFLAVQFGLTGNFWISKAGFSHVDIEGNATIVDWICICFQRKEQINGWDETWNHVPAPFFGNSSHLFEPNIPDCQAARWISLNFTLNEQKGICRQHLKFLFLTCESTRMAPSRVDPVLRPPRTASGFLLFVLHFDECERKMNVSKGFLWQSGVWSSLDLTQIGSFYWCENRCGMNK